MHEMFTPGYASQKTGRKKYTRNPKKYLNYYTPHDTIVFCGVYFSLFFHPGRAKDQKEVQTTMNKYELSLVVNAKIEDEVRTATVDKVKAYIERFGGTITDINEAGKKRLAYEIQKMHEGFYYFIKFDAEPDAPAELEHRLRIMDNVLRYLCVKQEA